MILRGTVVGGRGDFGRWIEKLHTHYRVKTGMDLFPGTLNVQLQTPYSLPERCLRLEPFEYGGTVGVSFVPCLIFERRAFILRTDANDTDSGDHPRTIIEIACDVKLRDRYRLADGDVVEVDVTDHHE